jgi:hypothetical protein
MVICPICGREMIEGPTIDGHHLIPKTHGNRDKRAYSKPNLVLIHRVCHQKIHHTFSDTDLLNHYHTVDRIVGHPEMQKYIKWIQRKEPEFIGKHKDTNTRRQKRHRR